MVRFDMGFSPARVIPPIHHIHVGFTTHALKKHVNMLFQPPVLTSTFETASIKKLSCMLIPTRLKALMQVRIYEEGRNLQYLSTNTTY
jgi:hypothetical protein